MMAALGTESRQQGQPLLNNGVGDQYNAIHEHKNDGLDQSQSRLLQQNQMMQRGANDEQAAQPFVNNQNTILMAARSCNGDLMLMHETRIFYFSSRHTDYQERSVSKTFDRFSHKNKKKEIITYAESADYLTGLLLAMLMTRKYRLITSFYTLWHILDYLMLGALISILFFTEESQDFIDIIKEYWLTFCVIGVELFYDVLEFIVKIWILNRVSIYIGFILYISYVIAFWHDGIWTPDDNKNLQLVIALLVARFVAFIFEETIDFCIDLELHYDLNQRTIHKLDIPWFTATETEERIALLHVGNHNDIQLPNGWEFKGSVCVWSYKNTFNLDPVKEQVVTGCWHKFYDILFHCMFFITYCIIGLPLLLFTGISMGCLTLVAMCCGRESLRDTIANECCHRYSY